MLYLTEYIQLCRVTQWTTPKYSLRYHIDNDFVFRYRTYKIINKRQDSDYV